METLKPILHNLIEKILVTEEIYKKASSSVHNEPMKVIFDKLAEKREKYVQELSEQLNRDRKSFHIGFAKSVKTKIAKLGMDFDDAMLQRNEFSILRECLKYDELLIDDYHKVLDEKEYVDQIEDVALFQLADIKKDMEIIREKKEAYDFIHEE